MFKQHRKIGQNVILYKVDLTSKAKADDYTLIDKCVSEGKEPFFILDFKVNESISPVNLDEPIIQNIKIVTRPVTDHEDDNELTKSNKFYRLCLYDSPIGHRFLDFLKNYSQKYGQGNNLNWYRSHITAEDSVGFEKLYVHLKQTNLTETFRKIGTRTECLTRDSLRTSESDTEDSDNTITSLVETAKKCTLIISRGYDIISNESYWCVSQIII